MEIVTVYRVVQPPRGYFEVGTLEEAEALANGNQIITIFREIYTEEEIKQKIQDDIAAALTDLNNE